MRLSTPTLLLMLIVALSGCADALKTADVGGADNEAFPTSGEFSRTAEDRLYAHDIEGARAEYAAWGDDAPRAGLAAAGEAITSLLLLPYANSTEKILTDHLGARDGLDAQTDVIWGDDGLIYFIARGVAWDDSPSTAGIKTLLVDKLPWTRQQLDSIDGFVRGLNNPVALLAEDLPLLAADLSTISEKLEIAIEADEFTTFFLPGEVFHDESLDLTLGKSELSLLRGVLKGAEAALYFIAAYDHGFTLERALGESIWQPVIDDEMDPDHLPGAAVVDYQVAHMNESLGRALADAEHLGAAQDAAADALGALARGVVLGVAESFTTALDWSAADELVATQFSEFLDAWAASMHERTALPFFEPELSADFSLLFEGRTIGEDENLLQIDEYDDGFGIVREVVVDEELIQTVFLDGVFDPALDTEPAPALTIEDDVSRLIDGVSGNVSDDFERSVGSAF